MRLNLQSIIKALLATLMTSTSLAHAAPVPAPAPSTSRYFVVQNIATEKTRVYERSVVPGTPHTLVFETDMVVGRPEEGRPDDPKAFITWLGHIRISDWQKFYSDRAGTYVPWYKAGQDINTIPAPISESVSKTLGAKKWVIHDENGKRAYGDYGWYAARLTPADESGANYQWIHGTIGWGVDGNDAIALTRGFFANMFSNPGSHGCTRLENRAVAFLRQLVPAGTDIYRVYARESTRESGVMLSRYADKFNNPGRWKYILLTDGAQKKDGLTADFATIVNQGIIIREGVNLIEEGVFSYDRYPTATPLNFSNSAASGTSGDRYQIDTGRVKDGTQFRGYFLVDEGRFVDYQHPNEKAVEGKVRVSGYSDFISSVPEFLQTTGNHYPPAAKYK